MSVEITMPKLSDTMEEGTIIRWGVKAGDRVSKGDVIAEVETDKAAMEMEAFENGTVAEIKVGEGETVPVGTVIAVLSSGKSEPVEEKKEKPSEAKVEIETSLEPPEEEKKEPPAAVEEKVSRPPEKEKLSEDHDDERIPVSPAARKLAEEKQIPLSGLQGTGPGGRIVLKDVEAKVGPEKSLDASESRDDGGEKTSIPETDSKAGRIRKVVARKMEESWKNIPHFYVTMVVNVSDAVRFHRDLQVSLNDFILAAVSRALRDHPGVNSLWLEGEVVPQADINVAFAVSTEQGLYSPVIRNSDRLSLQKIHGRSKELQQKIKKGTIRSEDMEGATFTISNMGMLGVESFSAIVTPPQSAALAVGAAGREAVVTENGDLEVVQRMRLTLSADHRVMDGADGAHFLKSIKHYLESPLTLIVMVE